MRLVGEVKAGRPGITELLASCEASHLLAAVEGATVPPDLSSFALATGRSGKFNCTADDPFCGVEATLTWKGSCIGHLPETIANDGGFPPESCLVNAVVRETEHGQTSADMANDRLNPLARDRELEQAFWECTKKKTGHECLTKIVGPPSQADSSVPAMHEMHCVPKVADAQSLVLMCSGSLAQRMCDSYGGLLDRRSPSSSLDGSAGSGFEYAVCSHDHELIIPLNLEQKPSTECVAAARAALHVDRIRFVLARRQAFAACATELGPQVVTDPKWEGVDGTFENLPDANQRLLSGVLKRQHQLFGSLQLPARCYGPSAVCRKVWGIEQFPVQNADEEPNSVGRIVARGCGNTIWTVEYMGGGTVGDGSWSDSLGHTLARVPSGTPPFDLTSGSLGDWWIINGIGNSYRGGNLFHAPKPGLVSQRMPDGKMRSYTPIGFPWLAENLCIKRGIAWEACSAVAKGSSALPASESEARQEKRARSAIMRDWPQDFLRIKRLRADVLSGRVMEKSQGESTRRQCQPILIDPCSGDLGEVCQHTLAGPSPCSGRSLPDDRCEVYRYVRLPLQQVE